MEEVKPTILAGALFKSYGEAAHQLAQKIELGEPITVEEINALPQGVNARFDNEITLLFLALRFRNLQAIDKLLEAGASPYMIDRPSTGSLRTFVFYLTLPGDPHDMKAGLPFMNEIIRLYLKHGGDPNNRLSEKSSKPFISQLALIENYEGIELLLEAGADPWAEDRIKDNAMVRIARKDSIRSQRYINELIDRGYFDEVELAKLQKFMRSIAAYVQRGDEISLGNQALGRRILKRNPDYPEDQATERLFEGPIPWDDVAKAD